MGDKFTDFDGYRPYSGELRNPGLAQLQNHEGETVRLEITKLYKAVDIDGGDKQAIEHESLTGLLERVHSQHIDFLPEGQFRSRAIRYHQEHSDVWRCSALLGAVSEGGWVNEVITRVCDATGSPVIDTRIDWRDWDFR